jgi:hypothetical protein
MEGHLNDAHARASTLNSMISEAVVKTAEEDQIVTGELGSTTGRLKTVRNDDASRVLGQAAARARWVSVLMWPLPAVTKLLAFAPQ